MPFIVYEIFHGAVPVSSMLGVGSVSPSQIELCGENEYVGTSYPVTVMCEIVSEQISRFTTTSYVPVVAFVIV